LKVFIVYWHQEPKSFNHAMLQTAISTFEEIGAEVRVSDLNAMQFNPVSDRRNFKTVKHPDYLKMEWCDLMIWQFPLWWLGLPAVLKGWVDRCYPLGRVYSKSKSFDNGVFKGKKAMLSLTTGGSADAYKSGAMMGDVMSLLKPIHYGMLRFVGYDILSPHIVYAPVRKTDEERKEEFIKYGNRLKHIGEETPIVVKGF